MRVICGHILIQRFFDVADQIDLHEAKKILAASGFSIFHAHTSRHAVQPYPPLEATLGPRPSGVPQADPLPATVRFYAVGTLVVTFILPLRNPTPPSELIELGQRILDHERAITECARPIAQELFQVVATACTPGEESAFLEDYTVFVISETDPSCDAAAFAAHLDIPRLLLGEPGQISAPEREHIMRHRFSYYPDELVVIDWNSALVYDPRSAPDVPNILEIATSQLLGLRAYDNMVGRALDRLYAELEPFKQNVLVNASSRYQKLSRRIMQLYIDVTEMTERIEASLEFWGDTWLARIHRAAVNAFDIPRWQRHLHEKLQVLGQINTHLVDQITTRRGLTAEYAIIILIILEILLAIGH